MSKPPQRALGLLRWFCPSQLIESIEGDLLEQFEDDVRSYGPRHAKWRFRFNVIRFLRYEIISRRNTNTTMMSKALLLNNLKISFRNIRKHFTYSSINLLGLALGISVCLLIYVHTTQQLSYDSFHPEVEQLHRGKSNGHLESSRRYDGKHPSSPGRSTY